MPTIDELPAAISVSDFDELVVSQSDTARKATRAQLLAGVQSALALPQNTLLGRVSPGLGAPENITIGANLNLSNGSITAPAPFAIGSLPQGAPPQAQDLVGISQGGQNAAVSYSAFMGGLSKLVGINGSNLLIAPTGGVGSRLVSAILADAISIESFGAIADGVTDNTAAFNAALQSGSPIRLGGQVYIVNGPLQIETPSVWLGVPGLTVIRKLNAVSQDAWIKVISSTALFSGISFDANGLALVDSPVMKVESSCQDSNFFQCQFTNGFGANNGNGLDIECGPGAIHKIQECVFLANAKNGVSATGNGTIIIKDCFASNNEAAGLNIGEGTGCYLFSNVCDENNTGMSVGSWESVADGQGQSPACTINGNACSNNQTWGLLVGGNSAIIQNNSCGSNGSISVGGGILARVSMSVFSGNQISGGNVGLDVRTSSYSIFTSNHIANATTGMLTGGCQNVIIRQNFLVSNQWGIDIAAIEPSLSTQLTGPISVCNNWLGFALAQGGGIFVHDGCRGLSICNNEFNGSGSATIGQSLWLHTDQAIIRANSWNNESVSAIQETNVGPLQALVVPDIADEVLVTSASNPVNSIMTSHQADTLGQIWLVLVTNAGSGYTFADVNITGAGHGAEATAIVSNGSVIWIVVANAGSGYGAIGDLATVTITGDGQGATANAYVGLPVVSGRTLRLDCNCSVQFAVAGVVPPQFNWTNFAITVPAFGSVEMIGAFGSWRATSFPSTDYLAPTGDGGVVLRSAGGGDLTLRPGSGGALHISNIAEPLGCTSSVGRGSPTGSIAAPPGSDFRNLNGGVGNTLWVKQTGTDTSGWVAIA